MRNLSGPLGRLIDPELAPYGAGAAPVWVWSLDATRLLWANPAGAAIFNAPSPAAATGSTIDPRSTAALQIARLAGGLPTHGPRLERLRGFGGRLGEPLLCSCARITLADGTGAILIHATRPAGPNLDRAEQARRLLDRIDEPVALFSPDGHTLAATSAASEMLAGASSLTAVEARHSDDTAPAVSMAKHSVGTGDAAMILLHWQPVERAAPETSASPFAADASETPAVGMPALEAAAIEAPTVAAPVDAGSAGHAPVPAPPPAQGERRAPPPPLRFVWQTDAAMHFTLASEEFLALASPTFASMLGQPWPAIANALGMDPEARVARAIETRDTWSGIAVPVPTRNGDAVLVELSGLPAFDRERTFQGYRGFGICRDVVRGLSPPTQPTLPEEPAAPVTAEPAPPSEPRPEPPLFQERPSLSVVPASPNVVPFRSAPAERTPSLTPIERKAFGELANRLTAQLRGAEDQLLATDEPPSDLSRSVEPQAIPDPAAPPPPMREIEAESERVVEADPNQREILDRLPVGVLVYRLDNLIYANRAFLEWTGYGRLDALADAGGLDALFVEPGVDTLGQNGVKSLAITTQRGSQVPVEARLFTTTWDEESALVLMLAQPSAKRAPAERAEVDTAMRARVDELSAILDLAADGVVITDHDGRVVSINPRAQELVARRADDIVGQPLADLFARSSERSLMAALSRAVDATPADAAARTPVDAVLQHPGLGSLSASVTIGRLGDDRLCVILRDSSSWRKTEDELIRARARAEANSAAKSDFLAKMSHEIRTPLNVIIGFSEVMLEERFGAIGNDRYKQYLKDIQTSGEHVIELLNDLLDLSKIEAGRLELDFAAVDLNELTQQCVALMQPQASRQRIIIRTSLTPSVHTVVADARSIRQIVLNLLSNSIKFTAPGGQVIVSTAVNEIGDVLLRVRDTGVGMSENDLAVAMEPFRQVTTSGRQGSGGSGLGLPLTKALAEANRATFHIQSAVDDGTLVEVAFRAAPLAAE